MRGDESLPGLRHAITRQYGKSAALAAAYAVLVARSYPLLKRALGHGQACLRLSVDGETLNVKPS